MSYVRAIGSRGFSETIFEEKKLAVSSQMKHF